MRVNQLIKISRPEVDLELSVLLEHFNCLAHASKHKAFNYFLAENTSFYAR